MQSHYQALADKAAHNAAFATTDDERAYWTSWCVYYSNRGRAGRASLSRLLNCKDRDFDMDSAIKSDRLYPSYTTREIEAWIATYDESDPVEAKMLAKAKLAIRQRDKSDPAYVPTLHERLNANR